MKFAPRNPAMVILCCLLALMAPDALRADTSAAGTATPEVVSQDSAAQSVIRKQSDKIQQNLLQLAQELRQNGLQGSDATILATVASHLSSLNADEMQKVMDALQGADAATDGPGRQRSLASAYEAQKTVALRLQGMAAELAAEEASSDLATELEKLIVRQSANLRRTQTLTRDGKTAQQLDEREQAVHTMTAAEQASIGRGIDQTLGAVTAAAAAPAGSPAAELGQGMLDAAKSLPLHDTGASATRLTQDGPFNDALTQESALRQDLNQLLQAALSGQSALTRLEQAQAELQRLIGSQQDLIAASKQNLTDGDTLAETELEIDDQSQVALALLRAINVDAVGQLGQAEQYMVDSSGELSRARNTGDAIKREGLVIDTLTAAQKLISQQITTAQAAGKNQTAADALAQAQQLQKEVRQAQQTAAANPLQTAEELRKMQQTAFAISPDAAAQMADAADQLQPNVARQNETPNLDQVPNSDRTQPAANPAAGTPPTPAQAAAADLARANDALQQKINALTQPAQEAAALAQAQQELAQAQQDAKQASQNIQAAGAQPADVPRNLDNAAAQAEQAAQTAQAAGGPAAAANQALQQAAADLKNGSQQAVQGNGAGAKAAAQQGIAALQQAQGALAQALQQMQGQGQAPNQGGPSALGGEAPQNTGGLLAGSGPQGGAAQVVGALSPQDRAAITQYQEEKTPPEYDPVVQQYLKNLANSQHAP